MRPVIRVKSKKFSYSNAHSKAHSATRPPSAAALAVAACFGFGGSNFAHANPTNPVVVNGAAQFTTTGNLLSITNTPNAIINWGSFSIGANEITRFVQQTASSSVLNRVVGQSPSSILGALQSNGRVFVINPNGIVFGAGSQINVGGLVASTLNLSDADFLAGRMRFENGLGNSILNSGNITTNTGGSVLLIGNAVTNNGIITSPKGEVILAAGNSVELVNPGTPDLRVELVAPDNKAVNLGHIVAESGRVGIYAGLINQAGHINASSVVVGESGQIMLKATRNTTIEATSTTTANGPSGGAITIQSGDTTLVSGTVEAKGSEGKGGDIKILGNLVGLTDNATVDASGTTGGGAILIGGDFQGKNPDVQNAFRTYVGENVTIKADATTTGDGGKVVVWADDVTRFYGKISAQGGAQAGDGGNVEVSGKSHLDFNGLVDTGAPNGNSGTLLLDPDSIDIVADTGNNTNINLGATFSAAGTGASTLKVGTLTAQLSKSSVTVSANGPGGFADGTITVNTPVTYNSANTLTFATPGTGFNDFVIINQPITNTGTGGLNFDANSQFQGVAKINANLIFNGGINFSANGFTTPTINGTTTITAGGGIFTGVTILVGDSANVTINGNVTGNLGVGTGGAGSAALKINGNWNGNGGHGITVQKGTGTASSLTITGTASTGPTGFLTLEGSTLDVGGNLTVGTGTSTISTAGASLTGAGNITFNGGPLNWSAGAIGAGGGTLTTNGTTTISGPVTLGRNWTMNGAGNNTGTLTVGSTVSISGSGPFNNTTPGVVNVNSGTFKLGVSGTDTGAYNVATGATLEINGGTRNINTANGINGAGTLNVSGGVLQGSGSVNIGSLNWTGGSITNTNLPLTVGGATAINVGANPVSLTNAANNFKGTVTVNNTGANDASITTTGDIALGASSVGNNFTVTTGGGGAASSTINVNGDLTAGGTLALRAPSSKTQGVNVNLNNNVNLNAPAVVISTNTSSSNPGNQLVVTGGNHTVSGTLDMPNGSIAVSGGALTVGGNINVTSGLFRGQFNLSGGTTTFNGTSIIADTRMSGNGQLNLAGAGAAGQMFVTNVFEMKGAAQVSGAGDILVRQFQGAGGAIGAGGGSFTTQIDNTSAVTGALTIGRNWLMNANLALNTANGAVTLANGAAWTIGTGATLSLNSTAAAPQISGAGAILNQSAVSVQAATTIGNVGDALTFTNNGAVNVSAGKLLKLNVGGNGNEAGTYSVNGAIEFAGGTRTFSGGVVDIRPAGATATFSGGAVTFINAPGTRYDDASVNSGGTTVSGGNLTFQGAGTLGRPLTLSAGAFTLTGPGAVVTLNGFNWTGGTINSVVLTTNGVSTIGGSAVLNLPSPWVNTGTATIVNQGLTVAGNVFNQGSGTLTGAAPLTVNGTFNHITGAALSYAGALGVTGITTINAGANPITLTNANNDFQAAVNLTGGATQITDKNALTLGTLATGALKANATGALNLGRGTVGGTLDAISNNGAITQAGVLTITGPSTIDAGTGAITLANANNDFGAGVTTLNGAAIQASDVNALNVALTATGPVTLNAGGLLTATGGFDNLTATGTGVNASSSAATFTAGNINSNNGPLTLAASAGKLVLNGVINAGTGTLNTSATGTQTLQSGAVSAGNYTISAGPGLTLAGGTLNIANTLTVNNLATLNLGTGGQTVNAGTLSVSNGGTLAGTGRVIGNVINAGVVAPGNSPGTLNITGNFTTTATGTVHIEVGGAIAGTQFDRINVGGNTSLGGLLSVTQLSGFVPPAGSGYQFINTSGTSTGNFASTNIAPAFAGMSVVYGMNFTDLVMPAPVSAVSNAPSNNNLLVAMQSTIPDNNEVRDISLAQVEQAVADSVCK